MSRFRKPFRSYIFLGPTPMFGGWGGLLRIFLLFEGTFIYLFLYFSYKKIVQKMFAYLPPDSKNIGTFPETRHLFRGFLPE